jgi:ADP-ribose pyrophosphatase YjhB (NUDIX family)
MDKPMKVEILDPPLFIRSGKVVDRVEAWEKGLWYGQFNIWIIRRKPVPAIVYQKRSPDIGWAPNKLDVPLGGHYENGEDFEPAVKTEAKEELGVEFKTEDFYYLGRKLAVNKGAFDGTNRNVVIDIYLLEDNRPISSYTILDKQEVYGLCELPVKDALGIFEGKMPKLKTKFLRNDGEEIEDTITKDSFPENWDDYQAKMVRLIDKYLKGEKGLKY